MQSIKEKTSGKNTLSKALNISEILDSMREDQRQFDKKIGELRVKVSTTKDKEMKKD
jgi:exoribonuclease R